MNNHRKIYEAHYGPIPRDHTGRSYDIHHIDGDHSNNDPQNLIALTIEDHLLVHQSQGDHKAVLAIMLRLAKSPQELSMAASKAAIQRVQEGSHHWLGGYHQKRMAQVLKSQGRLFVDTDQHKHNITNRNNTLVMEGKHNFQTNEHKHIVGESNKRRLESGEHPFSKGVGPANSRERVQKGTHHFLDSKKQTELSERAKLKNSQIIQRMSPDGDTKTFIGISDAVRNTSGATYGRIKKATTTGDIYLGYTWVNLGKNTLNEHDQSNTPHT